jgi:hypothetical protein
MELNPMIVGDAKSIRDGSPVKLCIDLHAQFGNQFKTQRDPAFAAGHSRDGNVDDPWGHVIPCMHGEFFPLGGDWLAASTYKRGKIANRLSALDCCTVVQDADDGLVVRFKVADFDAVAAVMRPRRRRVLSDAQRADLIEAGRPTRYASPSARPTPTP